MKAFFGKFVSFAASEQPLTTGAVGREATHDPTRGPR
jgi:hypothetical protein